MHLFCAYYSEEVYLLMSNLDVPERTAIPRFLSLLVSPLSSPQRMDLLLTYHNNLPGYTGYSPVYSLEGAKPRNCGANPKTTTGAGVLGLML